MITALCLNPCIDKTLHIDGFEYGGMNRVQSVETLGSGKGVNVAIAAAELGMQSECIGFLNEENGERIEDRLSAAGVRAQFVRLGGQVRTNIKLLNLSEGVVTEINEKGVSVGEGQLQDMLRLVCERAPSGGYLVLTGSLPPGCPDDYYKTIMLAVKNRGCKCVLDAEGESFRSGIQGQPYLVKPNQYELELSVGRSLNGVDEICAAAKELVAGGAQNVAVSMGAVGALITNGTQSFFAPKLNIKVRSTVGAGDSMVAGLLAGFSKDRTLPEAFACGVASASARVISEVPSVFRRSDYEKLLPEVKIIEI